MSENFPTKLIVGLVLAAAIGAGAYFWLSSGGGGIMSLQTGGNGEEDMELDVNTEEVLQQLNRLRGLTIQSDIFQSDIYYSLQDFGISITEQPIGRENPFISPPGNIPGGLIISNPVPVIEDPVVEEQINAEPIERNNTQPDSAATDSQTQAQQDDSDQNQGTDTATTTEEDTQSSTTTDSGAEEGESQ